MTSYTHIPSNDNLSSSTFLHRPSLSNLPLQICLQYNFLFSIVFAILYSSVSITKAKDFDSYLSLVLFLFWCFLELPRLYFGFKGNLQEDSSCILIFFTTSIAQIAVLIIISFYSAKITYPSETLLGVLMLLFEIFGAYFSYFTRKQILRKQNANYLRELSSEIKKQQ